MVRSAAKGFTLVELLVVMAIMAGVGAMAIGLLSRRGDKVPAFSRSLLSTVQEARQVALTQHQATRVYIDATSPPTFESQRLTAANGTTWVSIGGLNRVPKDIEICEPKTGPQLTTVSPTCPLAAARAICFAATGRVTVSSDTNCPGTGSGGTLYLKSDEGSNNPKKYKVVVWGLTGMAKLMDRW
jgi:prepilin-type N-terminal cleavage/methylation domain-containing protein